jgi:hypothetical protein
MTLGITALYQDAESHYECRFQSIVMLNAVVLSVTMLTA